MLQIYTYADMAGDVDLRKFLSGYSLTFVWGIAPWQSKLHQCVALSTIEAKYIAITEDCKEALWMNIRVGRKPRKLYCVLR